MPEVGDKLVCLRNDKTKGLLNGAVCARSRAAAACVARRYAHDLDRRGDAGAQADQDRRAAGFFRRDGRDLSYAQRRESDEFDFGYALTVHKAQGSQWDDVVLFDESWAFRENRERWLYTGVTRAAKSLTVVV